MIGAAGSVTAADLGSSHRSFCVGFSDSNILLMPEDDLAVTILRFRDEARAARESERVVASRRPAFTWAVSAELQCNISLGYMDGGHVDPVSTQKCDCFHSRMLGFM